MLNFGVFVFCLCVDKVWFCFSSIYFFQVFRETLSSDTPAVTKRNYAKNDFFCVRFSYMKSSERREKKNTLTIDPKKNCYVQLDCFIIWWWIWAETTLPVYVYPLLLTFVAIAVTVSARFAIAHRRHLLDSPVNTKYSLEMPIFSFIYRRNW